MMIRGSIVLPFVLIGAFGAANALLLASIGAWNGPEFVVCTAWRTSLNGALLATVAWRQGHASFAYVPAIILGAAIEFMIR